ncbi:hypothetical protein ACE6H2_004706 [Prunus campanulata]
MANYPTNDEQEKEEKLEKKIKELETTIGEQDDGLNYLQSSAFQLANFHFVFQGVILTAIVNGNSALRCSDRWFLFTLSLLAALLNLFSLLVIGGKYKRSIVQRDQTWFQCHALHTELATLKTSQANRQWSSTKAQVYGKELEPRSSGQTQPLSSKKKEVASEDPASVDIDEDEQKPRHRTVFHVDPWEDRKRKFYFVLCMVLFVIFAIIVIAGIWTISCRKDDQLM